MHSEGNHEHKTTYWLGKTLANAMCSKGLISKIYKELLQLNTKQTNKQKTKHKESDLIMGRGPEQTSFQRHTNGQQTHEKMLNTTNQENLNQNNEHLIPHRMAIIKRTRTNKCWQRWGEKGTLMNFGECKLVQSLCEAVQRFLKKLKIEMSYNQVIPLLGIYSKKKKTLIWKDICTPMFIAALFTVAKLWKQPKHPLIDE